MPDFTIDPETCNRGGICVKAYPPLSEALGLPSGHHAFGAVMVGYPRFKYPRMPARNVPKIDWI